MKSNITYTTRNDLCLGCGICSDACPTNSIRMHVENGEYRPTINPDTCLNKKGCHKCSMVCPGVGIKLDTIAKENFGIQQNFKHHNLVGYYVTSYSGYATDHEIRFHGASGGMLTAFLAFLLDRKYISAAVVVENDMTQPFLNQTILVHNSGELYKARSSKYCPVKFDGIVQQVKQETGKVVIVGLPCVMQGFRKYEKVDKNFKMKIFGYFGLFCSCGRSFNLTENVFQTRNIRKEQLSYFQYRDEGCLGYLVAKEQGVDKIIKEPFQSYYHPLRSFFIPHRCLLCIDHYAELADVSFGDIHYGKYQADKVGINSLVVRNIQFDALLKEATFMGYVKIEELKETELVDCQVAAPKKKNRVAGILKFRKMLGLKNPEYDVVLSHYVLWKAIAYYIFAQCQRFIGKRRYLWWIIKFMYKKQTVD